MLASRRDVGVPSMAHLPALTGEPTVISIAMVSPVGCPRDTVLGLTSLQTTTDSSAHSLEHRSLWGTPLVSFGWDVASEGIPTTRGWGGPDYQTMSTSMRGGQPHDPLWAPSCL